MVNQVVNEFSGDAGQVAVGGVGIGPTPQANHQAEGVLLGNLELLAEQNHLALLVQVGADFNPRVH
jgi:hypothetical protein